MKKETIAKTLIYLENDDDFNQKWFKFTAKSFINHIDTLYFFITPTIHHWNEDPRKIKLIEYLRKYKDYADNKRENMPIFEDIHENLEVRPYLSAGFYKYHFGIRDKFDVFICESCPNDKTPPIFVQLRSQSLWLDGIKNAFDNACDIVEKILLKYTLVIKKVQENRIDYAFHTNYIQDLMNFFPEKHLKNMQISNFMRFSKQGYFHKDSVIVDYFTLGQLRSNNVFLRVYDKTKEVCEMQYNQFFIAIWLNEGLISKFDEFVLKRVVLSGNWHLKDRARCEFYAIYGLDKEKCNEINSKLNNPDTPAVWFTDYANGLVPDVTTVCNIEIQTKRKFYDRLKESMPIVTEEDGYKKNIYNIYDQLTSYIQFITIDTIRFIKYKGKNSQIPRSERPTADWWKRLQTSKCFEDRIDFIDIPYFRAYQYNLDEEIVKSMCIKKMAAMSAYSNYGSCDFENLSVSDDVIDFVSSLNDNDIAKYWTAKDKVRKDIQVKLDKKRIKGEKNKS